MGPVVSTTGRKWSIILLPQGPEDKSAGRSWNVFPLPPRLIPPRTLLSPSVNAARVQTESMLQVNIGYPGVQEVVSDSSDTNSIVEQPNGGSL